MKIYNVTGGIGRQIAFTALIPKLAEKEKIIILTPYPDIFENNPHVSRVLPMAMPYAWTDYIQKKDNEIFAPEPYFNTRFIHREIHLIQAFCEVLGIEYNGSMKPQINIAKFILNDAEKFKIENKKFIITQFIGGQTPFSDFKCSIPQGQKRFYPAEKAQALVDKIHDAYPDLKVLNMSLPNEYQLKNTIVIQAPYLFYVALLNHCETFIGIDSSLNHMSAVNQKKGIVLWMGTSPVNFSYDHNINLIGECKFNDIHCSRPYVRELGDFMGNGQPWTCPDPSCQEIKPEIIFEELKRVL